MTTTELLKAQHGTEQEDMMDLELMILMGLMIILKPIMMF